MTYGELGKFNDLAKAAVTGLKVQRDMAQLAKTYANAAVPKLELPSYSEQKIQDTVRTYALGLGHSPALQNAIAAHGESLAYAKTQIRLQEIAQGLSRSFDLSNLGGVTAWRDLVAVDPTILRGVAEHAVFATNIGMPGGLTGVLGPKASAAAGLYGVTRSDKQGVHLSEDHALDIVLEATELLNDEENVAALADVEVDEALVEVLEDFFLTSEASIAVYEAATREIAVRGAGPKAQLQLRGMPVLSLFLVLYGVLVGGIAAAKPGQEVTLPDHLMAVGGSVTITTGVDYYGAQFVDRMRRMPDDDEEDPEEDPKRGNE